MRHIIACLLGTLILVQSSHAHNFAEVIQKVLPAVTYIRIETFVTRTSLDVDSQSIIRERERMSPYSGTGFVIEGNKVVTNYHVIQRAIDSDTEIYVYFQNNQGVRHSASILGYDKAADIALLEIEGEHPSLNFADNAADMLPGEEVFTISNYYSLRHSVSTGIISSNNRMERRYPYIRLFQVQLLQGSGSSGGPVFNQHGEVISINHTVLTMSTVPGNSSVLSSVAFTIRGDNLKNSLKRIKEEGIVQRADLGVYLQSYGPTSEKFLYDPIYDDDHANGVLISEVDNAPTNSSFQTDDIILKVEGKVFYHSSNLLRWLDSNFNPGDIIQMQLYRDGSVINTKVEIIDAKHKE